MSEDSVSIVTRTKNRPALIGRAVESVLGQTHQNWTHIVVNDGGERAVLDDILRRYQTRYAGRLKIIHNSESLGVTAALNIGMKASEAFYVNTHDDDDSWEPTFLSESIIALKKRKKLIPNTRGIMTHATAVHEFFEGDSICERYRCSFNGWVKTVALPRLAMSNFIPPISFLFERDVLSDIGFFDEKFRYGEDWEFYLRFLSKFEIALLPKHLANYHLRAASQDIYGNTIGHELDVHMLIANAFRNELIRRDLASGKFGLGHLVALSNGGTATGKIRSWLWHKSERARGRLKARISL